VMRGGMSNIGRFCLDLVQRAESKRRGEEFTRGDSFTMPQHTSEKSREAAQGIKSRFVDKLTATKAPT